MVDHVDWDTVEFEFRQNGFLAPSSSAFRDYLRSAMADWLDLAERINRLGQRMYIECSDHLPGRRLTDPTALGIQMIARCLSGYQGALLLAERGLGVEAQALVRSVFETAFWMGYISSGSNEAISQLRRETLTSEIGLFEAALEHLGSMADTTKSEVVRQLATMKSDKQMLPTPPKMEELAKAAGYAPSYFFYKELSGAATHLSMKSIHTFLQHDDHGEVVGHQVGPDEEGAGKAVWLGCRGMVLAMDALARLPECSSYQDELAALNDELVQLEPHNLRATTG